MRPLRLARPRGAIVLGAALLVAVAGLAAWLLVRGVPFSGLAFAVTPDQVEAFVAAWGMWSAVGAMLLMVLHSFVPLPAEIIAIANGMMFGPLWGTLVTWAGAMLGALSAFAVARWLGRPVLCRVVSEGRRTAIEGWVRRPGSLLLLRLLPVVSFNLVNVAAGIAGAGWWTFLWTTALGILPLTIATAFLGSHIFEIGWAVWLAIGVLILMLWALGKFLLGARRAP